MLTILSVVHWIQWWHVCGLVFAYFFSFPIDQMLQIQCTTWGSVALLFLHNKCNMIYCSLNFCSILFFSSFGQFSSFFFSFAQLHCKQCHFVYNNCEQSEVSCRNFTLKPNQHSSHVVIIIFCFSKSKNISVFQMISHNFSRNCLQLLLFMRTIHSIEMSAHCYNDQKNKVYRELWKIPIITVVGTLFCTVITSDFLIH